MKMGYEVFLTVCEEMSHYESGKTAVHYPAGC